MAVDFQYGQYYIQWCARDSNGYARGATATPDALADDSTTHSHLCTNPVDFTHAAPTRDTATDQGGQSIRGQADMGISAYGTGTFTLSELDDTLTAYFNASTIDTTTITNWRQLGYNALLASLPRGLLVASMKVQDISTGSDLWTHYVYPNVQVAPVFPSGSQGSGVNPNPLQYTYIPSPSTRSLTGELFSTLGMAQTDNKELMYRIRSSYPLGITCYQANGVATSFITGYRGVSSEVAFAENSFTKNGTQQAPTTYVNTTGVVTLSAAGSSGDVHIAVYATNYTAI